MSNSQSVMISKWTEALHDGDDDDDADETFNKIHCLKL